MKKVDEEFDDAEAVDDDRLLDFIRGCSQIQWSDMLIFFLLLSHNVE